ncbi:MAG TPA: hypothetical protein VEY91_00475 [Candidatus Limnocylindria bacterium]|nr:hypothetical protein [Candidatus Limnocylindria bacterium]
MLVNEHGRPPTGQDVVVREHSALPVGSKIGNVTLARSPLREGKSRDIAAQEKRFRSLEMATDLGVTPIVVISFEIAGGGAVTPGKHGRAENGDCSDSV